MQEDRASRVIGAAIVLLVLIVSVANGQESERKAFDRLLAARCLRCTLDEGTQAEWRGGRVKLTSARFGKAGVLTFDGINVKEGTARLIAGSVADVAVLVTPVGLTFLEQTGSGNLIVTTVFGDHALSGDRFAAVSSRHIATFTSPFPSQYHGTCTILE